MERGGSFKIGRPGSRGWKNVGRSWARMGGGELLKIGQFSLTSYMYRTLNKGK